MSAASSLARDERPAPGPRAVPPAARRAALLVHAMRELDRAWLLSQLRSEERAQLAPLLAELRELGISADRAILEQAIGATCGPDGRQQPADAQAEAMAALRGADPRKLARLLRNEPVLLVAKLLRITDWPWRAAVLQKLGSVTRRKVEQALRDRDEQPGEALQNHLVAALVRRIRT
jgi:Mg/Co/Ni transporter MgtE